MRAARLSRETFCECIMAVWCRPSSTRRASARALSKSATLTIGSTGISCSQVTQGRSPPPRLSAGEGARRNGETRRRQQRSRAFTDQFFIRRAVGQADGTQGIGLLSAQQQRVKILHLLDQGGQRRRRRRSGFFGDTGQVVIEGGAADNIFGGFDEIGGFINDARRIAGASADHFFYRFSCPSPQCRGRR